MAQNTTTNRMQIYNDLETVHRLEDLLKIQQAMKELDFGNNPRFEQSDNHALIILDTLLAKAHQEQGQALEASNHQRAIAMDAYEKGLGISVEKPTPPTLRDPLAIAQEHARQQRAEQMLGHEPAHPIQQASHQLQQPAQDQPQKKSRKTAITTRLDAQTNRAEDSTRVRIDKKVSSEKLARAETPKKDEIKPKVARDARTIFAKRRDALNPSGPKKKQ